jgi:hypothetical protein
MRKLLAVIPVLAMLAVPADLDAKNKHGNKAKNKHHSEWKTGTEQWRTRTEPIRGQWRHNSSTHPPHDANGDGVVSRREWPGNSNAFRQLDRNGDGVLSGADRQFRRDQRYYDDYRNQDSYRRSR